MSAPRSVVLDDLDFEAIHNHLRLRKELSLLHAYQKRKRPKKGFYRDAIFEWILEIGVIKDLSDRDLLNDILLAAEGIGIIKPQGRVFGFYEIL